MDDVEVSSTTETTTYTFNALDQVLTEARADGSDGKTTYDAVGNPVDRCTWVSDADRRGTGATATSD